MRPNTERRVLATELTDSETRHCQCRRFVKSRVNELDERALKLPAGFQGLLMSPAPGAAVPDGPSAGLMEKDHEQDQ